MEYIANIVTKNKIEVSSFFNVTSKFSDINTNIPTIIIGWNEVKQLFPKQDILNPNIDENIIWTFSKREKRYQYEKDIVKFINNVIKSIDDKIKYCFFNYILSEQNRRDKFIKYVQSGLCSLYYNSRFLYIYSIRDKITIGVSLNDLSYIGIKPKEFILMLNKNNNNIICDNLNCIASDSLSLIKDNTKIIAYLNYLKNSNIYKENTCDD
jgi:hypothetical protein